METETDIHIIMYVYTATHNEICLLLCICMPQHLVL